MNGDTTDKLTNKFYWTNYNSDLEAEIKRVVKRSNDCPTTV